uniref:Uncharacterized protein n=1 Tax=Oryzias latipes TaxID=8090 RepID=A0A3P9LID9_ORYLA
AQGLPSLRPLVAGIGYGTEPPKDHIIWSLCCFLYSNPLCLGLAALIFSIKSRDRKIVGDLEGARHYGFKCRNDLSNLFYSHNLKPILFVTLCYILFLQYFFAAESLKIIFFTSDKSLSRS